MASDAQNRKAEAIALDRVMKAAENIAARFPDIDAPTLPTRHRYPELLPMLRMEALADFLDALDAAMGGDTVSDATETPPDDDSAESDTQATDKADARTALAGTVKAKAKAR